MKSPFKLKSGNSTPFKMMGSSPVKQKATTYEEAYENLDYQKDQGEGTESTRNYGKIDKWGRKYEGSNVKGVKGGYTQADVDQAKIANPASTIKVGDYKEGDFDNAADKRGLDAFKKAAKAWNMKTYGTTEPTRDAKKAGISKKALAAKYKASKTTIDTTKQSVAVGPQTAETTKVSEQEFPTKGPVSTTKVAPKPLPEPQTYTRSQRRAKRKELKGKGFSRKERRAVVQSMRAETALAEGKEKKARKIAKRVNRKIASKRTRSASDKYLGPTSDRMVDLGL